MQTLYTAMQAAQYLGLKVQTLKVWRRLKKGPPFLRVGTRVRYELEELHAWVQGRNADTPTPTDELKEQAKAALTVARDRVVADLMAEIKHRQAIYTATGDEALAADGARWAAEIAEQAFPEGDPAKPDMLAVFAVLECETIRRLHSEAVTIPEALHAAMSEEPGRAAWSERPKEGGPVFYCAKAWAVSRFAGIDLSPLVHAAFSEMHPLESANV